MANQSLIADLLKTPSQIRKEREDRLLTEGLAQAQLFNQGNQLGGVGGMFAGFGAAQAANVGRGMDQAVTALRDAASSATGKDFRRGEERVAGEAQSIMRGVDTNNPQSMLTAANKLATINPRASEALRQRAQTLQASQEEAELAKQRFELDKSKFDSEKEYRSAQIELANKRARVASQQLATLEREDANQVLVETGLSDIAKDRTSLERIFGKNNKIVDEIVNAENPQAYFETIQERIQGVKTGDETATAAMKNYARLQEIIDSGDLDGAASFAAMIGAVSDPTEAQKLQDEADQEFLGSYGTEIQGFTRQNEAVTELLGLMKEHPNFAQFVFGPAAIKSVEDVPNAGIGDRIVRLAGGVASSGVIGDMIALRDQIKGGIYLSSYEQLKGAGQITEYEGKKAAAAASSLSSYLDISTDSAATALQEMLNQGQIAVTGLNRRYGALTGDTSTSGRLRYNASTGEFE